MILIEYPKCTTCQKAKKWLEEKELTIKKFAQSNGLNYGTILKALQRDEMSTKTANQILKATGLTYEEAFRMEE